MELSVVMPVYNCESYLRNGIESVLRQTYYNFQFVLVDDGSTDASGSICDEYAQKDSRICVIHQKNSGAGAARNRGIDEAVGKYIVFPDADDVCKKDMFKTLLDRMEKDNSHLAICTFDEVKIYNDFHEIAHHGVLYDRLCEDPATCRKEWFEMRKISIGLLNAPWNKIYLTDIIKENNLRFPDIRRAQDAVFNLRYFDKISRLSVMADNLYYYNSNNFLRTGKKFPRDAYLCFVQYNKVMKDIITSWGMYYGEYKTLCDNNLIGNLSECIELCNNPVWHMNRQEKIEYVSSVISDDYVQHRILDYSGNVEELDPYIDLIRRRKAKAIINQIYKDMLRNKARGNRILRMMYGFFKKN